MSERGDHGAAYGTPSAPSSGTDIMSAAVLRRAYFVTSPAWLMLEAADSGEGRSTESGLAFLEKPPPRLARTAGKRHWHIFCPQLGCTACGMFLLIRRDVLCTPFAAEV